MKPWLSLTERSKDNLVDGLSSLVLFEMTQRDKALRVQTLKGPGQNDSSWHATTHGRGSLPNLPKVKAYLPPPAPSAAAVEVKTRQPDVV